MWVEAATQTHIAPLSSSKFTCTPRGYLQQDLAMILPMGYGAGLSVCLWGCWVSLKYGTDTQQSEMPQRQVQSHKEHGQKCTLLLIPPPLCPQQGSIHGDATPQNIRQPNKVPRPRGEGHKGQRLPCSVGPRVQLVAAEMV